MGDHGLDGGTGGLEVLAGVEIAGMLGEVLADGGGHGQTQVGVDVDLILLFDCLVLDICYFFCFLIVIFTD